jgi:hypothetical protein
LSGGSSRGNEDEQHETSPVEAPRTSRVEFQSCQHPRDSDRTLKIQENNVVT